MRHHVTCPNSRRRMLNVLAIIWCRCILSYVYECDPDGNRRHRAMLSTV
jgi:hypothetical protein